MPKYEIKTDLQGEQSIWATYEDGRVSVIPMDESNADYKAYLAETDGETL